MPFRKGRFSVLVRVACLKCDHTVVLLMRLSSRDLKEVNFGKAVHTTAFCYCFTLVWKFRFFSNPKLSLGFLAQLLVSLHPL